MILVSHRLLINVQRVCIARLADMNQLSSNTIQLQVVIQRELSQIGIITWYFLVSQELLFCI